MEKLIIIRGPSGAGKSTVSKELFKRSTRPTLLVSEDYVRKMFSDHRKLGHEPSKKLAIEAVLLGLKTGYDVIYEGILNLKTSGDNLDELFDVHQEENYLFYLDVSLEETQKRHETRPEKAEFGTEAMARWWEYASPSGHINETVIPGSSSLKDTIRLIGQIAGLELKPIA
jgi:adenylate kinase family enzyme